MTTPAAAARPRTLSAPWSPFALPAGIAAWRELPSLGVPTGMRGVSGSHYPTHNSIPATLLVDVVPTADVTPATAGGDGAAKQAAPPRGAPR